MKYVFFGCICAFILSCKKDKKSEPSKTELITASTWIYDNGGVDINKDGTVDLPFSVVGIQPCLLDNKGTFNSNGTGVNDEGATKCDPALPQTTSFTWSFANNESALNVAGSGLFGISGQFKINALTSTQLGLSKDTVYSGSSVTIIANLKH